MSWNAKLADHKHVKRGLQRLGDLVRNRHAAARQAEHDHVVTPGVVGERGGDNTASVASVGKAGLGADSLRVGT